MRINKFTFGILALVFGINAHALTTMECYGIRSRYMNPDEGKLNAAVANLNEAALENMKAQLQQYLSDCEQDYSYYGKPKIEAILDIAKELHAKQPAPVVVATTSPDTEKRSPNDPEVNIGKAISASRYYKDCLAYGKTKKQESDQPEAWTLVCKMKSLGKVWQVSLKAHGLDQNDKRFSLTETVETAPPDCFENHDCTPTEVASLWFTEHQFEKQNFTKEMTPQITKSWQAALSAAGNSLSAKQDRAKCETGSAIACERLLKDASVTDTQLLTKACSLKVEMACQRLKKDKEVKAEALRQEKQLADANDAKKKKKESNECQAANLALRYCKQMAGVEHLQRQIDHEKAVGKETGFVNAYKMNNDVSTRMFLEKQAKETAAKYYQINSSSTINCSAPLDQKQNEACGN